MQYYAKPMQSGPEAAPFAWLLEEADEGRPGALLTIAAVHGGAPRPVGAQMAVSIGARFEGFLSGGCVEQAIAREVEAIIDRGRDATLRFGMGSPFFDIRFPCGGGIDVLVHVAPTADLLEEVLYRMARRQPFSLAFEPSAGRCTILDAVRTTGWSGDVFRRSYLPGTRLCLAGRGPELEAVVGLGAALNYEMLVATPDVDTAGRLTHLPAQVRHLSSPSDVVAVPDDPWTATVLLFHEREWEEPILAAALNGTGFYIGALGSERTHALRCERLLQKGHAAAAVDRITGPIGMIPAARDPETLALSVLAEIAVRRREADQCRDWFEHG